MWEAPQVPNSRMRHLRCLPHSGVFAILTVRASYRLAPTLHCDKILCILPASMLDSIATQQTRPGSIKGDAQWGRGLSRSGLFQFNGLLKEFHGLISFSFLFAQVSFFFIQKSLGIVRVDGPKSLVQQSLGQLILLMIV